MTGSIWLCFLYFFQNVNCLKNHIRTSLPLSPVLGFNSFITCVSNKQALCSPVCLFASFLSFHVWTFWPLIDSFVPSPHFISPISLPLSRSTQVNHSSVAISPENVLSVSVSFYNLPCIPPLSLLPLLVLPLVIPPTPPPLRAWNPSSSNHTTALRASCWLVEACAP